MNVKNTIISKRREAKTKLNWEIIDEDGSSLKVVNQKNGAGVVIPKDVLLPAARTPSGLKTMEIQTPYDYAVNARFTNDDFFWDDASPETILKKRAPHLKSRQGRLLIAGRNHVGITSDGTYWISFCSKDNIVPTWSFWSIKLDDAIDAKILCLWINSTYALTCLYDIRIVGTGAYVGWLKPDLLQMYVPNVSILSEEQRVRLNALFDEIISQNAVPLIDQLSLPSEQRLRLDRGLAEILDIEAYKSEENLRFLYKVVAWKFRSLEYGNNVE